MTFKMLVILDALSEFSVAQFTLERLVPLMGFDVGLQVIVGHKGFLAEVTLEALSLFVNRFNVSDHGQATGENALTVSTFSVFFVDIFHVPVTMLFSSKNFRAIVTQKLFTLVRMHKGFVVIQFLPVFKLSITQVTCGAFFAVIVNVLDVVNQVLLGVKSLGTFVTMMVPLTSMSQHVIFKLSVIYKGFATCFANMMVVFFLLVDMFDMLQILLLQSIKFATLATFEISLLFVNLHDVVFQMLLGKFLATNTTWFNISVHNSDMSFPFLFAVIQFSTIFTFEGSLDQVSMHL